MQSVSGTTWFGRPGGRHLGSNRFISSLHDSYPETKNAPKHQVDWQLVYFPIVLDNSQLSYLSRAFSFHSFHVLPDASRVPFPIYYAYIQFFFLFGNSGASFTFDDVGDGDITTTWLGPEALDSPGILDQLGTVHFDLESYAVPYRSEVDPAYVCLERDCSCVASLGVGSFWFHTLTAAEILQRVRKCEGGFYLLEPNLMNASGNCFNGEFRYETSRQDANLLWPCRFRSGPEFKMYRHSWVHTGSVNVNGFVLHSRLITVLGECRVYHITAFQGSIVLEPQTRSLQSWFTEENYGYMPISQWNDFRNQRLTQHLYVSQTELCELEMSWVFSMGNNLLLAPVGGSEMFFIDKGLVYATALEVGIKERDAKLFRNVYSQMRVANRNSAERLEVDYRSFLMAVAIGFSLNASFEISLMSRVLRNLPEFKVLNNLLAFQPPVYLHWGVMVAWSCRLVLVLSLFYWFFYMYYGIYVVPLLAPYIELGLSTVWHLLWPLILMVILWVGVGYGADVYWWLVRARTWWRNPGNDVAKRVHRSFMWWFGSKRATKGFRRTVFSNNRLLKKRIEDIPATLIADDLPPLIPIFHSEEEARLQEIADGNLQPTFHEERMGIPTAPPLEHVVDVVPVTHALKAHINNKCDWSDYEWARKGLVMQTQGEDLLGEIDEKAFISFPDLTGIQFPTDWCVPYGPTIDLGARVPQRDPNMLAVSVMRRLLVPKHEKSIDFDNVLSEYATTLRSLYHGSEYGLTTGVITPCHFADVIANFPMEKRRRLRDAFNGRTEPKIPRLSLHVKMEVLLIGDRDDLESEVPIKKARVITAVDEDTEIAEMPFGKAYQNVMANTLNGRTHVVFMLCRSHSEISDVVSEFIFQARRFAAEKSLPISFSYLSYDVVNWDGTTRPEMRAVEEQFEDYLDASRSVLRAKTVRSMRPYRATSVYGHKVGATAVTVSGGITTFSRNSVRNGASTITSIKRSGQTVKLGDTLVLVGGDDGGVLSWTLEWTQQQRFTYEASMLELGHKLETEYHFGLAQICRGQLCSTRWIRLRRRKDGIVVWYPFPLIGKMFAKLYWYANPAREMITSMVKGDTLGYLKKFAKIRILKLLFETVLKYIPANVEPVVTDRFKFTSYMHDIELEYDECEETWADINLVYNIGQQEFESAVQYIIDTMHEFKTFNVGYYDWVFAHMLRVDQSSKIDFDGDL